MQELSQLARTRNYNRKAFYVQIRPPGTKKRERVREERNEE